MTAIHIKGTGGYHSHRQHRRHFLEIMVHGLIILCTTLAIVLSTIAVCDGQWLQAPDGRMLGLWDSCTSKAMDLNKESGNTGASMNDIISGGEHHQAQTPMSESLPAEYHAKPSVPNCTAQLGKTGVSGIDAGLVLSRCMVSLAVVVAMFGLELQMIAQVSEGQDACHRWALGSVLVLSAAALSATGTAVLVTMLFLTFASPLSFTLTFWGQGTAVFLFFLNGMAARHLHLMNELKLPFGPLGKYQA